MLRVLDACQVSLERRAQDRPPARFYPNGQRAIITSNGPIEYEGCDIGAGTKISHYSHVLKGAVIGEHCIFGQNSALPRAS